MSRIITVILLPALLAGCLGQIPVDDTRATAWFLDVGYGEAVVVHSQDRTLVIDGGYPVMSEFLVRFLSDRNLTRIHTLVVTHPHPDHIGGAYGVLVSDIDVEHAAGIFNREDHRNPAGFRAALKGMDYRVLRRGDQMQIWEGSPVDVLHPDDIVPDLNDSSMVLKIELLGRILLLPADIGPAAQQSLIAEYGESLKCDILKAPHHGGAGKKDFVTLTRPEIIVLSVGINPYGNPYPETIQWYLDSGATFLRTDQDGSVRLDWSTSRPIRIERHCVPRGTFP